MKFQGACAIVTGGADGIGKALVEDLVSKGTRVVFGDISTEKGRELSTRLNKNGKCVVFCPCDVRKEADLMNLFDVATQEFGGAQILVNNAGIGPAENFTTSTAAVDAIIDINLTAVLKGTSLAIQHFRKQQTASSNKDFCVVNVSSFSALIPATEAPVYSSSKKAVMYFSQSLGYLAKKRIRVSCVLPYFAKTALIGEFMKNPDLVGKINNRGGFVSISKIVDAITMLIEDEKMAGDSIAITPKETKILPRLNRSAL